MPRIRAIIGMSAILLLLACGSVPENGGSVSCGDCNVILITVDTLRADHLGAYGHERETSPKIDAFGASAITFEDAVAQSCWTAPSMLSLMSSKFFSRLQRDPSTALYTDLRLPEVFARNGYRTAAFVAHPALEKNFERGFDLYDDSHAVGRTGISSEPLTTAAIEWIEGAGREKFFLWIHYFDPHAQYIPPSPFDAKFTGDYDGSLYKGFHFGKLRELFRKGALTPSDIEFVIGLYDGEIAYNDHHVGRLLKALQRLDEGKNVVLLAADHGEELGDRTTIAQHRVSLYEEVVHTPLMLQYPGIEPSRVSFRVGNIDIGPTLLSLAGLEVPPEFDGESLLEVKADRSQITECDYVVKNQDTRTRYKLAALYERDRKVIHHFQEQRTELYDLREDPGERRDLSDWHPGATTQQRERLLAYLFADEQATRYYGEKFVPEFDEETLKELRALGYVN